MRNHPPRLTRKINLQPVVKNPFSSPSNLLGLAGGGQAGFVDYERNVFEHTMELSVAGYLRGALERSKTQRHFASPADQSAFSAALEAELKAIAEDGRLPEPFFDYVIMARKA